MCRKKPLMKTVGIILLLAALLSGSTAAAEASMTETAAGEAAQAMFRMTDHWIRKRNTDNKKKVVKPENGAPEHI